MEAPMTLNRRDAMIRLGQLGLGTLALPGLLAAEQARTETAAVSRRRTKTKSCIFLFLWGGPPQQDLWDLKPHAPQGIRSLFQPINTNVPGIQICDQMPLLAKQMDKVCVVRSVTHNSDTHEPSVYHMLTGRQDPMLVIPRNNRSRMNYPGIGSVLARFSEPAPLPANVTIPRPIGHDGITYAGTHAGFLGPRFDPLEPKEAPSAQEGKKFPVALPADMTDGRLMARRGLVGLIEKQDQFLNRQRSTEGLNGFYEQAFRMVSSPVAKRAFNLDYEPAALRERYGRNEYGESFLLARRLVEAGVRLVTATWMYIFPNGRVANVWDNHAGYGIHGANTGYDLLKSPVCIPPLDRAYSALVEDLSQRGLLDETLIAMAGEVGRTPKINGDAGRDHWGPCQSALLAGGGIRGGQVYGASDKIAAYPKDSPVSPEDFLATIYHAMGISPENEVRDQNGRPYAISTGKPVTALF